MFTGRDRRTLLSPQVRSENRSGRQMEYCQRWYQFLHSAVEPGRAGL